MTEMAKVKTVNNIIFIDHPVVINKENGAKLNSVLKEVLAKEIDKNKKFAVFNDFSQTKMGEGLDDYKKAGMEFSDSIKAKEHIQIFIISNPVLRVIAGAVTVLTGKKAH